MPQSRAAMAVGRILAPAARRARARPVRRARRQDHPPGRADGGPRRGRRGRAPCRARGGARAARPRAWARPRRGAHGRRRRPHEPGAYDRVLVDPPCSDLGTLASRPDARWRKQAAAARAARGAAGRDPARRGGRAAPRRHARLLHLHDLAGGERGRRGSLPGRARGLRRRRPRLVRVVGLAAWTEAACTSRRSHTATAPTGSSSPACAGQEPREPRRRRPRRRLPGLRRAVAAPHEPARAATAA